MKKLSFLFKKQYLYLFLTIPALFILFIITSHFKAQADTPNTFTGCISANAGLFYNVKSGTSPFNPCPTGDAQVSASNGTITSVIAGTGLTGGGTSGDVTISHANVTRVITANIMGWPSEFYSSMGLGWGVRMMSSGNTGAVYTFALPFDYAGGDHRVREWYYVHDAAGTAVLNKTIQSSASSDGTVTNIESGVSDNLTASSQGDIVKVSTISASSVHKGDLFNVQIGRSGDDASDTMGRLDLKGVAVEYTANQ